MISRLNPSVSSSPSGTILAGIPSANNTLYHQIRFSVGDPAAWICIHAPSKAGDAGRSILIIRDIEMDRARRHARADQVACPAQFAPEGGLSGDRETATAQAAAECLVRHGVRNVVADRTLPLSFAYEIENRGIGLIYDADLGVMTRRMKDAEEIAALRRSQHATEGAIAMAIGKIAASQARDGVLYLDGAPLTSERLRAAIDVWLLERGYSNPTSIIAGGQICADCHDHGHGELRTGEPIILDVFPRNRETLYWGDCTRTVVHGAIPETLQRMHAAVVEAKRAATAAVRPGVSGEEVHAATTSAILCHGFGVGFPPEGASSDWCGIVHGTGHGVGLDIHEPPLLDRKGPLLLRGDAITIEPGLYCRSIGGIRVEDMVVVTETGCENLNTLPESLACGDYPAGW